MATDGRLIDIAPYGQHIALTCRNHPNLRWSTKNISPIGARTLFYNLRNVQGMGPECDCSIRDLIVLESKLS